MVIKIVMTLCLAMSSQGFASNQTTIVPLRYAATHADVMQQIERLHSLSHALENSCTIKNLESIRVSLLENQVLLSSMSSRDKGMSINSCNACLRSLQREFHRSRNEIKPLTSKPSRRWHKARQLKGLYNRVMSTPGAHRNAVCRTLEIIAAAQSDPNPDTLRKFNARMEALYYEEARILVQFIPIDSDSSSNDQ